MFRFRQPPFRGTRTVLACLLLLLGPTGVRAAEAPAAPPLYALIVGGGPDAASNAAQIEGHVRFVAGLLPVAAPRVVLFADGRSDHASVSHADLSPAADARRALSILLADRDAAEPTLLRVPDLGASPDGPSRLPEFRRALAKLSAPAARSPAPLLLYFAGHGARDEKREEDTAYVLWNGETLKVRALAAELARLPRNVPVVLVMAQCFSGAFANVLFRRGDPTGAPVDQPIAGFFSARKDREAAGCSTATGQADYQDFSSYFFGALSGRDRFGRVVDGADYDHDDRVSLHEAFCYALIHDDSADTPVCTSDAFLKRFAPLPEAAIYGTPYAETWQAATAAQRAALDALSAQLGLAGEARALAAFDRLTFGDPVARPALVRAQNEAKEQLNAARQTALAPLFARWPALRWDAPGDRSGALGDATDHFAGDQELCRRLIDAGKASEQAAGKVENEEAALQRFVGLYENIVEAQSLRARGKEETRTRFERLWQAEQRSLPTAALPR